MSACVKTKLLSGTITIRQYTNIQIDYDIYVAIYIPLSTENVGVGEGTIVVAVDIL